MPKIPHLDISVDYEDPEDSLKALVQQIRPHWNLDKVRHEDKSTGYINKNIKVFVEDPDEAFIIRLVTKGFDDSFIGAQRLVHTFTDQVKLGPQVFCTFQNGIAVEFLKGKILTWDTRSGIQDANVWPLTADILAKWHTRAILEKAEQFGIPDKTVNFMEEIVIPPMNALKYSDPESDFCKALPSGEDFVEESKYCVRLFRKLSPTTSFIHMDANPTNWVLNGEKTLVIDYDATGIFFASADIAWFFMLHADYRDLDLKDYPDVDYQRKWLKRYLTKRRELDGEKDQVTDEIVEKLREEIDVGLIFALLQATFSAILISVLNQKAGSNAIRPEIILRNWAAYKSRKAIFVAKGYK